MVVGERLDNAVLNLLRTTLYVSVHGRNHIDQRLAADWLTVVIGVTPNGPAAPDVYQVHVVAQPSRHIVSGDLSEGVEVAGQVVVDGRVAAQGRNCLKLAG